MIATNQMYANEMPDASSGQDKGPASDVSSNSHAVVEGV